MDGLVLHFDPEKGSGLIRASDGKRYRFDTAQSRSSTSPRPGDMVDFEIEDETVTDVYVVQPGAQSATAEAAGATVTAQPDPILYLSQRPGLTPAGLIIVSCFLPFISVPFLSVSLFGIVSYVSSALSMASAFGGGSAGARLALWSFYLLYAIPGSAGWLIYREFRGEGSPGLRRKVGLIGLAGPFAVYFLSALIVAASTASRAPTFTYDRTLGGTAPNMGASGAPGMGAPDISSILSVIGIGWVLLAVASASLIAVGSGWSPFSKGASTLAAAEEADLAGAEVGMADRSRGFIDSPVYDSAEGESGEAPVSFVMHLARLAQIASLLCFLLPWAVISWATVNTNPFSSQPESVSQTVRVSGFGLIKGEVVSSPSLAVILAAALIVASLALSFVWNWRKAALTALIACGTAAAVLLWYVLALLPQSFAAQTSTSIGFWLTLVALAIAIVVYWTSSRDAE